METVYARQHAKGYFMLCYSNIVIQIIESALKPKIENNLKKKKRIKLKNISFASVQFWEGKNRLMVFPYIGTKV